MDWYRRVPVLKALRFVVNTASVVVCIELVVFLRRQEFCVVSVATRSGDNLENKQPPNSSSSLRASHLLEAKCCSVRR
jgi:hypothetical protein